jgi:hypothetical protein
MKTKRKFLIVTSCFEIPEIKFEIPEIKIDSFWNSKKKKKIQNAKNKKTK